MKKRIIIALIILIVCAGVGLSLYFFVFKKNNLTQDQATSIIVRAAIDIEAIDSSELEGVEDIDFKKLETGSGGKNIIKSKPLPSINNLIFISEDYDPSATYYTENIVKVKYLAKFCAYFMSIDKLEPNTVYKTTVENEELKMIYKIIKNEVLFVIKNITTDTLEMISFFYDSSDKEYEYVHVVNRTSGGMSDFYVERFKANINGFLSYEYYALEGVSESDTLTSIGNGEGISKAYILDYVNKTYKTFNSINALEEHLSLSKYIYQISENFNDGLKKVKETLTKETNPKQVNFWSD